LSGDSDAGNSTSHKNSPVIHNFITSALHDNSLDEKQTNLTWHGKSASLTA